MTKLSSVSSFVHPSPSPLNLRLSISSLNPCSVIIFLSSVTLMYESPQTIFGCVMSQYMPRVTSTGTVALETIVGVEWL